MCGEIANPQQIPKMGEFNKGIFITNLNLKTLYICRVKLYSEVNKQNHFPLTKSILK